jgi:hypothetical protein
MEVEGIATFPVIRSHPTREINILRKVRGLPYEFCNLKDGRGGEIKLWKSEMKHEGEYNLEEAFEGSMH